MGRFRDACGCHGACCDGIGAVAVVVFVVIVDNDVSVAISRAFGDLSRTVWTSEKTLDSASMPLSSSSIVAVSVVVVVVVVVSMASLPLTSILRRFKDRSPLFVVKFCAVKVGNVIVFEKRE